MINEWAALAPRSTELYTYLALVMACPTYRQCSCSQCCTFVGIGCNKCIRTNRWSSCHEAWYWSSVHVLSVDSAGSTTVPQVFRLKHRTEKHAETKMYVSFQTTTAPTWTFATPRTTWEWKIHRVNMYQQVCPFYARYPTLHKRSACS